MAVVIRSNRIAAVTRANVRRVFDGGILVLARTDTGVTGVLLGVSSQTELVLLVEAGLTPAGALRAATLNPAKMSIRGHADKGH